MNEGYIAILGAGKIGQALLEGLLGAGWEPGRLSVTGGASGRAGAIGRAYGVKAQSNPQAAAWAGTILIAVKPRDVPGLLTEVSPRLPASTLVISLAAGVPTSFLEARLPLGTPVVRVMTNTAVAVRQAMSVIAAGSHARRNDLAAAAAILGAVGRVVSLPEAQLNAVTAVSGSGPAYIFYVVEAMIEAGVELGLSPQVATELVTQTAIGAALTLRDSGQGPAQLREAVTSRGGTTAAALRELEAQEVKAAIRAAIRAAAARAAELAAESEMHPGE